MAEPATPAACSAACIAVSSAYMVDDLRGVIRVGLPAMQRILTRS